MRKTLQKLLIVTTALTFSCNTFSVSAMLKGDKRKETSDRKPPNEAMNNIANNEGNNITNKYEELDEQLKKCREGLDEVMEEQNLTVTEMKEYQLSMKEFEKKIEEENNKINAIRQDIENNTQLKNIMYECEYYLPGLKAIVEMHSNMGENTECVNGTLNIINNLQTMIGVKGSNWENKMFELENKLKELINLSCMYNSWKSPYDIGKAILENTKQALNNMERKQSNCKGYIYNIGGYSYSDDGALYNYDSKSKSNRILYSSGQLLYNIVQNFKKIRGI